MKLVIAATVVGLASAACPNNCAGHGTCGEATQCDCYRNWFGADCSDRICTYSAAFVDSPVGDLNGDGEHGPARYFDPRLNTKVFGIDFVGGGQSELYSSNYGYARSGRTAEHDEAHFYRECANKGICDRTSGLCSCFPGYEGEGCTRTSCPADCSGHGVCRTIADSHTTYSAWDLEHTQQCLCDPGYTGPACAQRMCPKGADPVEYALQVTNSVQGIFWRSFSKQVAKTAQAEIEYAKTMPSTVHYTLTYQDEFGDDHVTSLLSVEYKSECVKDAGFCLTVPDFAAQSLQEHAEATNESLGALPLGAIENKYVWTVGTQYTAADGKATAADYTAWLGAGNNAVKAAQYPRDFYQGGAKPETPSHFTESLDFRLDQQVIPTACKGVDLSIDNSPAEQYGLCMFIQISNPGVQHPLKVQSFWKPSLAGDTAGKLIQHEIVSAQTKGFNGNTALDDAKNKVNPGLSQYLATVMELNTHRVWNPTDGDVSKAFITKPITDLAYCSKRGLCDFDTGMCDCFSGYSGVRCDDQNAIAYSY